MNKKQQQTLVGIIIVIIGLIYVMQSYLVGPLSKSIKEKSDELSRVNAEIQTLKIQSLELPRIRKQLEYLQSEVADLEKFLPREKELPSLLKAITRTASNYQVKILNISPAGTSEKDKYTEHIFNISAQSTYHSLAMFLAEISQGGRIISSRDLNFSPLMSAPPAPGARPSNTISVNFQLVAYTYKG